MAIKLQTNYDRRGRDWDYSVPPNIIAETVPLLSTAMKWCQLCWSVPNWEQLVWVFGSRIINYLHALLPKWISLLFLFKSLLNCSELNCCIEVLYWLVQATLVGHFILLETLDFPKTHFGADGQPWGLKPALQNCVDGGCSHSVELPPDSSRNTTERV